MEVYATIFMIFVSHVLSTFTQTFSSWQKDGRSIPQPKFRRMVYFKNHNNDEENQWHTALEHIMPLIDRSREKLAKGDPQYEAEKIARAKIPDEKSPREFLHIFDSDDFVSSLEKNHLRKLTRKNKQSSNQHVLPSIITTNQSFHCAKDNNEVVLKELNTNKINNIPLIQSSATEALANRAKMKFITVRPWNEFCSNCNTPNDLKDNYIKTYRTCRTKRRRTYKPLIPCEKSTSPLEPPWLFYSDPIKMRNRINQCSTKAIDCKKKQRNKRSTYLKFERNNHNENFIKRPGNKKINYFLPSENQLGILKSAPKRYKKNTNKNCFIHHEDAETNASEKKRLSTLGKNFLHNSLLSRINKSKRRSLNIIENKKKCDLVALKSFRRRNKNGNLEQRIPPCQKSCNYNLPALVNAQTIKPLEYFRRRPTILLCCGDEVKTSLSTTLAVSRTNELDDLEATTEMANATNSPLDDLLELNGEKIESEIESVPKPLYYLVSFKSNDTFEDNPNIVSMMKTGSIKKIQPWDKFCPCSGGKLSTICNEVIGINRQPWVSKCFECISTNEDTITRETCGTYPQNLLLTDSHLVSTAKSRDPDLQVIRKAHEEDLENSHNNQTNQTRPDQKTLLFLRVPVARDQSWNLFLPFRNTSNTKNVKPRSILDLLMPSLFKRSTIRPIEHLLQPWEEPWKFRQEKFNLFTTSLCATYVPGTIMHDPPTTINEPPFFNKSLLEYIAETCPSCSKHKKIKATNKQYDEIETTDQLYYDDICSDNSTYNELPKDKSDPLYVLKLPGVDIINISSPAAKKVKPLSGLTILHSHDSPPKYFIEVPELLAGLRNIDVNARSSSPPPVSPAKKSKLRPKKFRNVGRKKPKVLFLQPFEINGNDVYLPVSDLDIPDKGKPSVSDCTKHTVSCNHKGHTSYSRSKTILDGLLHENDSALPFVLVPAYLAMRPPTTPPTLQLIEADFPPNINGYRKPFLYDNSYAKIKDQDDELPILLNNLLLEKKSNKQLIHTRPMKGTVANYIGLKKKSLRKPLSSRSSVSPSKPPFIILMDGMADAPFLNDSEFLLNKSDFPIMNQKDTVTIKQLEDYILI